MWDDLSAGVGRYGADRAIFGAAAVLRGLRKKIQLLGTAHSPGRKIFVFFACIPIYVSYHVILPIPAAYTQAQ